MYRFVLKNLLSLSSIQLITPPPSLFQKSSLLKAGNAFPSSIMLQMCLLVCQTNSLKKTEYRMVNTKEHRLSPQKQSAMQSLKLLRFFWVGCGFEASFAIAFSAVIAGTFRECKWGERTGRKNAGRNAKYFNFTRICCAVVVLIRFVLAHSGAAGATAWL